MNREELLKEGDTVDVYFDHCPWLEEAKVCYAPSIPGDVLIVKDKNGFLCYIQNYSFLRKIR